MKKRLPIFLAGAITALALIPLTLTVMAVNGMTITVSPINIQVDGADFKPTDAKGNSVPVFTYDGTTYAPLRALAEAYGLEVGYNAEKNMATVGETAEPETPETLPTDYSNWTAEEEAEYQEFKGDWTFRLSDTNKDGEIYAADYIGTMSDEKLVNQLDDAKHMSYIERMAREHYSGVSGIYMVFYGTSDGLASVWIEENLLKRIQVHTYLYN